MTEDSKPRVARVVEEWGVKRKWGMEWGGSYGMSHSYHYTAESVWALSDGNPVYRRYRTVYVEDVTEPELVTRSET